jgi:hypothetical protein
MFCSGLNVLQWADSTDSTSIIVVSIDNMLGFTCIARAKDVL